MFYGDPEITDGIICSVFMVGILKLMGGNLADGTASCEQAVILSASEWKGLESLQLLQE